MSSICATVLTPGPLCSTLQKDLRITFLNLTRILEELRLYHFALFTISVLASMTAGCDRMDQQMIRATHQPKFVERKIEKQNMHNL